MFRFTLCRFTPRRLRWWASRGGTVAALAGLGTVAFTGMALACHAEVSASVNCTGVVSYSATSWDPGKADGQNPDIGVYYAKGSMINWANPGAPVATGAFTAGTTSFTGTFTVANFTPGDKIDVGTRADGVWGNGDAGHETRDTGLFTVTGDCTNHTTPTTPTVTAQSCDSSTPGDVKSGSIDIPSQAGVSYAIDGTPAGAGSHDATPGTHTVTATANNGYTLDGTTTWKLTVGSAGDCTSHVTPQTPSVTDQSCTGTPGGIQSGTVTIPAQTGVSYTLDGQPATAGSHDVAPGTHTVTATADHGYALTGTSSWTLTVAKSGDCTSHLQPATPSVVSQACTGPGTHSDGSLTLTAVPGVEYAVNGTPAAAGTIPEQPGTYVVTATAQPGYTLDGPATFTETVGGAGDCLVTANPVAPSVVQSACLLGVGATTPTYTIAPATGVTYLDEAGNPIVPGDYNGAIGTTLTITPVAVPGYTLAAGTPAQYTLSFAAPAGCAANPHADVLSDCTTRVLTLGNTGELAVTFTLTPQQGSPVTVTVAPGGTATHRFDRSAGTVTVTAPGLHTLVAPAGKRCGPTQVLGEKITRHHAQPRTPHRVSAVSAAQLPFTGLPTGMLVLLGLTALGVGGALTMTGARRRSEDATPTT